VGLGVGIKAWKSLRHARDETLRTLTMSAGSERRRQAWWFFKALVLFLIGFDRSIQIPKGKFSMPFKCDTAPLNPLTLIDCQHNDELHPASVLLLLSLFNQPQYEIEMESQNG
jgi:hypothetical protein